jgi:DNA-binding transcriptional MerR regulator
MASFRIGAVASRAGTNAPTIRYYESIGLLPSAERRDGGQRTYGPADLQRLLFIRRCRDFGFSIEQVRTLVSLVEDKRRSCTEARDIAQAHLDAVREKMRELRELEKSLTNFVGDCDARCAGGPGPDCVILYDLSQPGQMRMKPHKGCCS